MAITNTYDIWKLVSFIDINTTFVKLSTLRMKKKSYKRDRHFSIKVNFFLNKHLFRRQFLCEWFSNCICGETKYQSKKY